MDKNEFNNGYNMVFLKIKILNVLFSLSFCDICKQCGIKFYYKEIRILGQIELFIFNGVKVFQEFGFDIIIQLDVGF